MLRYPRDLILLIAHLKKLPGVGKKSAERFAFELLNWSEKDLFSLSALLNAIKTKIKTCGGCGCLISDANCQFCMSQDRHTGVMCVVANQRDVYAIEETNTFQGIYHVLGSLLSPLDGNTTDNINFSLLNERIIKLKIKELILAFDSTIEGDVTSLFIKEQFSLNIRVSRLALGLPIGSSLDFIDEKTLSQAICGRQKL
jgi:recombination protein RecR